MPCARGSSAPLPELSCGKTGHSCECPRRRGTENSVVLGGPQLNAGPGGLVVEDAVSAEVAAVATVRRLPQVHRLIGRTGVVCLLGVEAGPGQVTIQDSGCYRVGCQRAHRAAADPVFAPPRVISGIHHRAGSDLWLIDGGDRLSLVRKPG